MSTSNETKYIAYYRVSTDEQGKSGLGLDAQKSEVLRTIGNNGIIVNSYTDIESGKKNDRKQLELAIKECRKIGATLVIAKMDRLSRDMNFLCNIRSSNLPFKACDMPDLTTLTFGIYITIAQHELETIGKRTKDGLKAKVERERLTNPDYKLGSPIASQTMNEINHLGRKAHSDKAAKNENNIKAISLITALKNNGKTWTEIKNELNSNGYKTSRNCEFDVKAVQRLFERSLMTD